MEPLLVILVVLLVIALLCGGLVAHWIWIIAVILLVLVLLQVIAGRRGV
jgi:hypothetical protein